MQSDGSQQRNALYFPCRPISSGHSLLDNVENVSMAEKPDTERRLTELETKLSFQDDTIDKLNAIILEQWKLIELHTRQIAALNERLQEAEKNAAPVRNEPPPHY
ncbi:SlyX family protein [Afipia sp. P52-10]|uniref:SlyX family protein n=1 Tax=Afipia sp. P52-10 TaxID=1429916 RepID=UPI0026C1A496